MLRIRRKGYGPYLPMSESTLGQSYIKTYMHRPPPEAEMLAALERTA